jgi:cellulose biosynthesis protein BcsQ
MKVITLFNNKGGVGKTTLCVNIASYLKKKCGQKVILLDADPQANSTQMMIPEDRWNNFYEEQHSSATIMDFLAPLEEGDASIKIIEIPYKATDVDNRFGIDLIPGHPRLSIIEDILSDSWNKSVSGDLGGVRKTNWLKMLVESVKDNYDFMFIDLGPSLGALNRSILLNTDFVVIPMGSDIFSLVGIENISSWMRNWKRTYKNGISILEANNNPAVLQKYPLNLYKELKTQIVGFSVQQYFTKTFKTGRRPVAAYDKIMSQIPDAIGKNLQEYIFNNLSIEDLNLGDVPYLNSIVPLAQSNNAPMYDLKGSDGIIGPQKQQVTKFEEMLNNICVRLLNNIGEKNE